MNDQLSHRLGQKTMNNPFGVNRESSSTDCSALFVSSQDPNQEHDNNDGD